MSGLQLQVATQAATASTDAVALHQTLLAAQALGAPQSVLLAAVEPARLASYRKLLVELETT